MSAFAAVGDEQVSLGEGFQPGDYDVMCGRGTKTLTHIGNRRFRVTIAMNLDKYMNLNSRLERSCRVKEIVKSIREAGGHFIKQENPRSGIWFDIGDKAAREKVGHALRDAQSDRSSSGKLRKLQFKTANKQRHQADVTSRAGFQDLVNDLIMIRSPSPLSCNSDTVVEKRASKLRQKQQKMEAKTRSSSSSGSNNPLLYVQEQSRPTQKYLCEIDVNKMTGNTQSHLRDPLLSSDDEESDEGYDDLYDDGNDLWALEDSTLMPLNLVGNDDGSAHENVPQQVVFDNTNIFEQESVQEIYELLRDSDCDDSWSCGSLF